MRLIDADNLAAKIMMEAPDFMDGGSSITKAFILAMVKTRSITPTVDAVQIVRCKDCKYHHYDPDQTPYCDRLAYEGIGWKDNDFCSYAKKRWWDDKSKEETDENTQTERTTEENQQKRENLV